MKTIFRNLRSDEVEVRPSEMKEDKVSLLLYQDARCAMNVLDDAVGQFNWQKDYYEARGQLFCKIGIKDSNTSEWVWKSDTGTESNIEADKGLASDAFKRAAVAWGIGRELYTAPKISVTLTDKDKFNGKLSQRFKVGKMNVEDGEITSLTIIDKLGKERFSYSKGNVQSLLYTESPSPSQADARPIQSSGMPNDEILSSFYNERKGDESINRKQLEAFFKFYSKPSDDDPSKSRIATWEHLDIGKLWDKWMKSAWS